MPERIHLNEGPSEIDYPSTAHGDRKDISQAMKDTLEALQKMKFSETPKETDEQTNESSPSQPQEKK